MRRIIGRFSRFAILMVVVFIVFSLVRCMGNGKVQKCEKLLKEKYDEEFTVIQTWTQPLGADVTKSEYHAVCSPVAHPEILFEITVEDFADKRFTDTYTKGIISSKLANLLQSEIVNYFGECYVRTYALRYSPVFSSYDEVTISNYLEQINDDPGGMYDVVINTDVYHNNDFDEEFDFLFQSLSEVNASTGISCSMRVTFLPNDNYQEFLKISDTLAEKNSTIDQTYDGFLSYSFGYNDETQEWLFIVYTAPIVGEAITKEDYVRIRKDGIE